jgi:hypothetical protein
VSGVDPSLCTGDSAASIASHPRSREYARSRIQKAKIVLFPAKIDPKSGAGHSLIFTVSRIGAGDEERRIGMVIEVFAKRRSARWAV